MNGEPRVALRPVVNWPREVRPERSYLITVDLATEGSGWPYEQEEYAVTCILDGPSWCTVSAAGSNTLVVHRFGGTYGPVRFVARVHGRGGPLDSLRLTFITAGGLPFHSLELPVRPVRDTTDEQLVELTVQGVAVRPVGGTDLVAELNLLYRAAGRPSYRRISAEIRRDNHMPDTVSHETVGAILRGDIVVKWSKVECVIRQLAAMAVHRPDPDEEVRRLHPLWLATAGRLSRSGAPPAAGQRSGAPPAAGQRSATPPAAGQRSATLGPAEPPLGPIVPPAGFSASAQAGSSASPPAGFSASAPVGLSAPVVAPTGLAPRSDPGFTGRERLLQSIGAGLAAEPWQPLILYGLNGMGKTQLAAEYVHRHANEYDLVWWISAEDPSQVATSLAALGERQDWPTSLDMRQTVDSVLGRLEAGGSRWLIVFDNAGAPDDVRSLLPAAGGHVIVTTRDAAWLELGRPVEVDVFDRRESIELLRARGHDISFDEADQLADRLGDLPLALGQVAAMQSATRTRVQEYLRQLDQRTPALLAAAPLGEYPTTVATAFTVAADRVRRESPAAAQLLELLSCLGADPISLTLLRSGGGRLPPPLGRLLDQPAPLAEAVRLLSRYGLVRVLDDGQTLQVHRLVQAIVRDALAEDARERAYGNARRLLAAANPGNPDRPMTWDMYAQLGPHLRPARAIESPDPVVRQLVLDQCAYLFEIGDLDGSRRLSQEAWTAWSRDGADDEQVLGCRWRLVAALHALGRYEESHRLADEAWTRLVSHPDYGPDHSATLELADVMAMLQRVFGRYDEALRLDRDTVDRRRRIRGDDHGGTQRAQSSLAASLRAVGDFRAAYDIDAYLVETHRRSLGPDHPRTLLSISDLARDLYGLGRYAEALELQRSAWPAHRAQLGDRHPHALAAWRTIVQALRKTGQLDSAVKEGGRLHLICQGHLGWDHELTLAAMMTHANTLCAAGQASRAWTLATEAVDRYRRRFGVSNPLTLAAATNQAIILRAVGERRRARHVGETSLHTLQDVLGPDHPYTIAAAIGVGHDLALAHEEETAERLLSRTLTEARRVLGERHPDTLICGVNLGLLLPEDDPRARPLLTSGLDELRRALGADHPLVTAIAQRRRGECDIEPPPV